MDNQSKVQRTVIFPNKQTIKTDLLKHQYKASRKSVKMVTTQMFMSEIISETLCQKMKTFIQANIQLLNLVKYRNLSRKVNHFQLVQDCLILVLMKQNYEVIKIIQIFKRISILIGRNQRNVQYRFYKLKKELNNENNMKILIQKVINANGAVQHQYQKLQRQSNRKQLKKQVKIDIDPQKIEIRDKSQQDIQKNNKKAQSKDKRKIRIKSSVKQEKLPKSRYQSKFIQNFYTTIFNHEIRDLLNTIIRRDKGAFFRVYRQKNVYKRYFQLYEDAFILVRVDQLRQKCSKKQIFIYIGQQIQRTCNSIQKRFKKLTKLTQQQLLCHIKNPQKFNKSYRHYIQDPYLKQIESNNSQGFQQSKSLTACQQHIGVKQDKKDFQQQKQKQKQKQQLVLKKQQQQEQCYSVIQTQIQQSPTPIEAFPQVILEHEQINENYLKNEKQLMIDYQSKEKDNDNDKDQEQIKQCEQISKCDNLKYNSVKSSKFLTKSIFKDSIQTYANDQSQKDTHFSSFDFIQQNIFCQKSKKQIKSNKITFKNKQNLMNETKRREQLLKYHQHEILAQKQIILSSKEKKINFSIDLKDVLKETLLQENSLNDMKGFQVLPVLKLYVVKKIIYKPIQIQQSLQNSI